MKRLQQGVLIGCTIVASWLGMQVVHELGHVLGAWLTGGHVVRVVLHPLTISRTEVDHNPSPLVVVWAGPTFGIAAPLVLWGLARLLRWRLTFLLRFFAGFCLIANGAYIGAGSFDRVGDCGEMLRHGSPIVTLWLFGLAAVAVGLSVWHGEGKHFGLAAAQGQVDRGAVLVSALAASMLVIVGLLN